MSQEANIVIKEFAFGAEVSTHANTTVNACLLNLQNKNTKRRKGDRTVFIAKFCCKILFIILL